MAEEGLHKTDNNLIFIGEPIDMDDDRFLMQLAELKDACYKEVTDVKERVSEIVTTYHPAGEHGSEKKGEVYERLLGGKTAEK